MLIKIHQSYRNIIAICDKELLGKIFEEDEFQLDIKESFFKGDEIKKEELIEKMRHFRQEDSTFNIIGEKSVSTAKEAGIILKENINQIQGIPFALILL